MKSPLEKSEAMLLYDKDKNTKLLVRVKEHDKGFAFNSLGTKYDEILHGR